MRASISSVGKANEVVGELRSTPKPVQAWDMNRSRHLLACIGLSDLIRWCITKAMVSNGGEVRNGK